MKNNFFQNDRSLIKKLLIIVKKILRYAFLFLIFGCFAIGIYNGLLQIVREGYAYNHDKIVNGEITLSSDDISNNELVLLNGEWEIYPRKYLFPKDFSNSQYDKQYSEVPGTWAENGIMQEQGYGTYRAVFKMENPSERIAIRVADIGHSFKLFINGDEVLSAGKLGTDKSEVIPEHKYETITFAPKENNEIVVQICNYIFTSGGMYYPIIIGSEEAISNITKINQGKDIFLLGMFMILIFHYLIVSTRVIKINKAPSYFFMATIIGMVYVLCSNERIIYWFSKNVSYKLVNGLFYMSPIWGGTFFLIFLKMFFPKENIKYIRNISIIKSAIFTILIIVSSVEVFGRFSNWYNFSAFIDYIFGILICARALFSKRIGALTILISVAILIATIMADIGFYTGKFISVYGIFSPIGVLIFLFGFGIVIAIQFYKSFEETYKLSVELSRIDKIKDDFIATTSHELRTPLNIMIALTESAIEKMNSPVDSETKKNLSLVVSSGKRLENLTRDILDYTKLKYGDLKLTKTTFSINLILENVIKELSILAVKKNIELISEKKSVEIFVYADKYRIIQVLYNLIENAIKFTPENNIIQISLMEEDEIVAISVKDSGIGINKEDMDRIFSSYEQIDSSISRNYEGIGLGLAITKKIIEAHGSKISVDSKKGEGAKFTFYLPKKTMKSNENEEKNIIYNRTETIYDSQEKIEIIGEKEDIIVIIDDDILNITSVSNLLKIEGYTIKGFVNPKEALEEIFTNSKVYLVILDLMMPQISGYELCQRIREKFSIVELPILILTARVQLASLLESMKIGANDILYKPFDSMELKARVGTLYSLKTTMQKAIENELSFLRAQIKPHFLYNALNTISALCIDEPNEASDLIDELSVYLRSSFQISEKSKLTMISDEMNLVKAYVSIEKARFGNKINFGYDVDENMVFIIPPLIIQPIIENAIRHGILKKGGGNVFLTIRDFQEKVYISIEDDGVGMTEDFVQNLFYSSKENGSVGLSNVNKRLIRMYGKGLNIETKIGVGTKITYEIPRYDMKKGVQ